MQTFKNLFPFGLFLFQLSSLILSMLVGMGEVTLNLFWQIYAGLGCLTLLGMLHRTVGRASNWGTQFILLFSVLMTVVLFTITGKVQGMAADGGAIGLWSIMTAGLIGLLLNDFYKRHFRPHNSGEAS